MRRSWASGRSNPPAAADARAYAAIMSRSEPAAACLAIGLASAQPSSVARGRFLER